MCLCVSVVPRRGVATRLCCIMLLAPSSRLLELAASPSPQHLGEALALLVAHVVVLTMLTFGVAACVHKRHKKQLPSKKQDRVARSAAARSIKSTLRGGTTSTATSGGGGAEALSTGGGAFDPLAHMAPVQPPWPTAKRAAHFPADYLAPIVDEQGLQHFLREQDRQSREPRQLHRRPVRSSFASSPPPVPVGSPPPAASRRAG